MYEHVLEHYRELHLIVQKQISVIERMLEIEFTDHETSFSHFSLQLQWNEVSFMFPIKQKLLLYAMQELALLKF